MIPLDGVKIFRKQWIRHTSEYKVNIITSEGSISKYSEPLDILSTLSSDTDWLCSFFLLLFSVLPLFSPLPTSYFYLCSFLKDYAILYVSFKSLNKYLFCFL